MSSTGTNQGTAAGSTKQCSTTKNNKNESEWVSIELIVPFDNDLTRKIKIRKNDTFGHLIHRWQMITGSNVSLPLVLHTEDGPKFIRETDTPNDLKNVDYGEMVVFDLGPPDVYWDENEYDEDSDN